MLTHLTVRCDWPGCTAVVTVEHLAQSIHKAGWKVESEGNYSMHLCPAHKRKSWDALRLEQFKANLETAHRTPG